METKAVKEKICLNESGECRGDKSIGNGYTVEILKNFAPFLKWHDLQAIYPEIFDLCKKTFSSELYNACLLGKKEIYKSMLEKL